MLEDIYFKKQKGAAIDKVIAFGTGGGKIVYFPVSKKVWEQMEFLRKLVDKEEMHFNDLLEKKLI